MSRADTTIVSFRQRVGDVVQAQAVGDRRDVVILAIDGIPADLARQHWPGARTETLTSVFPTTSSTAWLSSLTGAPVEGHGVPGVVYRDAGGRLINVYQEAAPPAAVDTNIFTDAAALGYRPIAIGGDLEDVPCGWRDALLLGAEAVWDNRFYTLGGKPYVAPEASAILSAVERAITGVMDAEDPGPRLIWCFVETDLHVHHFGYDAHVDAMLQGVEALAGRLVDAGAIVIAHSDHGLVPTRQSSKVAALFDDLQTQGATVGGAGRTRWIYAAPGQEDPTFQKVSEALAGVAQVDWADTWFAPGSPVRASVGDIVVIALGEVFLAPPGYTYEHGSLLDREVLVPFSIWSAARGG